MKRVRSYFFKYRVFRLLAVHVAIFLAEAPLSSPLAITPFYSAVVHGLTDRRYSPPGELTLARSRHLTVKTR